MNQDIDLAAESIGGHLSAGFVGDTVELDACDEVQQFACQVLRCPWARRAVRDFSRVLLC